MDLPTLIETRMFAEPRGKKSYRMTCSYVVHWTAVIAVGLLALIPRPSVADPRQVSLQYDIHLGGFDVGSVELVAELTAHSYRMRSVTRTDGLIDLVVGFLSQAESHGAIESRRVSPARHRADNVWMGEDRFVRNLYRAGRVSTDISPSPADDDRPPVPASATAGTLDPLSASLRASFLAGAETPCAESVPVFDGRRRYNLNFAHIAGSSPVRAGHVRPSQHCQVTLERIVGFSRKPWLTPVKGVEVANIWFKPLIADLPLIPVRLTADTGVGEAIVQLVALNGGKLASTP